MRHFADFLQYIKFVKQYSPHTIRAYQKDLEQFFEFIASGVDADESTISHHQIRAWIMQNMEAGNTARSVNRKLSALKNYFRYLLKEGIVSYNPLLKVLALKPQRKLPAFVKENQMDQLLDEVDFGDDFRGLRNRIIIDTFYNTGIRIAELIHIACGDVDFGKQTIKVLGKRNKERIIPVSQEFAATLEHYASARNEAFPESPWFFVTDKGQQLYQRFVYRIVNSYLGLVTTLDKKSPHVLRHTFATAMLNKGADLNAIKELLGHANLSATEVYTHNTFEKLKSEYKQAHPRA